MIKPMIFLTSLMLAASSHASHKFLTFTNPVIHSLDGVTYMLDGKAMHDLLVITKKLNNMLGNKNQHNSIAYLAQLEENNPEIMTDLIIRKHDFIAKNEHLIKAIEPAKKLIVALVEEFCEKRNRTDSIILVWAKARSGDEAAIFNNQINSFKDFEIFLTDLTLFFKDLVNSCPKAREQYKEWYKKQKLLLTQLTKERV